MSVYNDKKLNMRLVYAVFAAYAILLVWVVIFKCTLPEVFSYSFTQKSVAYRFERGIIPLTYSYYKYQLTDILLNAAVFVPLGIYLSFMLKKMYALPIIPLVSVTFELVQLLTGFGWFDTMDVISNVLGGFFGILLYIVLRPHLKDSLINKVNFILAIILGLIATAVIIYIPIYFTLGKPFNYTSVYY